MVCQRLLEVRRKGPGSLKREQLRKVLRRWKIRERARTRVQREFRNKVSSEGFQQHGSRLQLSIFRQRAQHSINTLLNNAIFEQQQQIAPAVPVDDSSRGGD